MHCSFLKALLLHWCPSERLPAIPHRAVNGFEQGMDTNAPVMLECAAVCLLEDFWVPFPQSQAGKTKVRLSLPSASKLLDRQVTKVQASAI